MYVDRRFIYTNRFKNIPIKYDYIFYCDILCIPITLYFEKQWNWDEIGEILFNPDEYIHQWRHML